MHATFFLSIFVLKLFFLELKIKLLILVYSLLFIFSNSSKENIFFIKFLLLIIFFTLLNCSVFETKTTDGLQSFIIYS